MKARPYLLALVAVFALAAPAFAQSHGIDNTGFLGHPGIGSHIVSRAFTSAILTDASGNAVGKVKTATIVTDNRGTIEGLRIQAHGLTPNTEYALVIDGTLVGTKTSDANGNLTMKFISPSNGRVAAIPDAIKPISSAHTVQIYVASSQTLAASGQLSSDSK